MNDDVSPGTAQDARRADFVRRSLWFTAAVPLGTLATLLSDLFVNGSNIFVNVLPIALLIYPVVLSVLAWRYARHYARKAAWAWYALSILLVLLWLALIAGAVYLMQLGSAFSRP